MPRETPQHFQVVFKKNQSFKFKKKKIPFRTLKKLTLENCLVSDRVCEGMTQGLSHVGVRQILDGCTNLTELDIGWTGLTEQGVRAVCEHVKVYSLRHL